MHGISTGQLSTWRKQFRSGELTGFVPVSLVADAALPQPAAVPEVSDDAPAAVGMIEIVLPSGVKLRIAEHQRDTLDKAARAEAREKDRQASVPSTGAPHPPSIASHVASPDRRLQRHH
jgi:transposase-like protein